MQPPKVMRWVVVLALAEGVFLKPDKVVDIDEQIQVLENQKSEATVEDLQKATQTIQTQAAAAAEEALAAQKHVEEMEMQQKALLAKANDYIAQQKESVKYAKDSNKELEKELEKAKQFAKTADASVKDLAKTAVQQMFIAKNKELSSWRDEVLTDHWALGRSQAIEAAEPYKHAWGEALEKANSYKSTARTLSSVAKGLADEANKATLTAAEKRMAGDADGALRLSQAAGAMRSHGRKLEGYAKDLQQESEHLFEAAPSYLSSGQQAAARAEWNANPKALPPMTLDPSVAYVPA
mmetsp:Transcript_95404/g.132545  ORF Transcript_95404/g.132545 Transcript_95404/m.132545 type:complete len:295 (+) Transcript_95404:44-928(+)